MTRAQQADQVEPEWESPMPSERETVVHIGPPDKGQTQSESVDFSKQEVPTSVN